MTEVCWSVRADRRAVSIERVHGELLDLARSVEGLELELADLDALRLRADTGGFRDFVIVARLRSEDQRILDWVGQELIAEFGFTVDWREDSPP